jgi:hypothetical protein
MSSLSAIYYRGQPNSPLNMCVGQLNRADGGKSKLAAEFVAASKILPVKNIIYGIYIYIHTSIYIYIYGSKSNSATIYIYTYAVGGKLLL